MRRTYRFLLRPTSKQVVALNSTLRIHCEIYNAGLEHRRGAWSRSRKTVSYFEQCVEFTELRTLRADIGALHVQSAREPLRRLEQTFAAFYRRSKRGGKPGYPRFKSPSRWDSLVIPQPPADGALRSGRLNVPGIGSIRCHQHRAIPDAARVKQVIVKREGSRWYALLSCDDLPVHALAPTGAVAGMDLGIASFLTTSDGVHIANPRYGAASAARLATAQRLMMRCKRGSARRQRARERVAAIQGRVRRQRLDHAHKTALALVRGYDLIVHEALGVKNMTRSPASRPDDLGGYLPNGAAVKAGLNRSILDAGWGVFLRVLAGKAEEAGRELIAVDPRDTSRTCPECGYVAAENRVSQAVFRCGRCDHAAHADVVGATNILRAGLARRDAYVA